MYRVKRVPIELKKIAPSYFQAIMANEVLTDLVGQICDVYFDELIIFGDSEDEFINNL